MSTEKRTGESIIVALDSDTERKVTRSGTMSRTLIALQNHPAGLTVEEIADICGLKPISVYTHGVLELFNAQLVERTQVRSQGTVYRLISIQDISVASPEREGARSLEDAKRR